jgi:hypothetical protein
MLRRTMGGSFAQAWTMLMCPFEGSLQLLAGSNEEIQDENRQAWRADW